MKLKTTIFIFKMLPSNCIKKINSYWNVHGIINFSNKFIDFNMKKNLLKILELTFELKTSILLTKLTKNYST